MSVNKMILKGAIEGKRENQYIIGEKYFFGIGERRNRAIAASWYEEAAKRGHAAAQYMYGYILLTGDGAKVNLRRGNSFLKRSAAQNNLQAILQLARNYFYGYGLEKNDKKAFKLWKKGASLGCPEAEYYLGLCYAKGIYVRADVLKSKKYLLSALDKGFSLADEAVGDLTAA